MKYLIVQDWSNTHGNHAGMVHMCKMLEQQYPDQYRVIIKACPVMFSALKKEHTGIFNKIFIHILQNLYSKFLYSLEYDELCKIMFRELKDGDEVFLLEYLLKEHPQYELAKYIRSNFPKVKLFALSHLTVSYFKQKSNIKEILKWAQPIDKMLTLGSSLSNYFESVGIPKSKISTGFHYVDNKYYHKESDSHLTINNPITIIAMGSLQRDYKLLAEVVANTPKVHWIICKGNKPVNDMFPQNNMVELKGYLSEDELRHQMDKSDVSINIMSDTVGSNVVTTSMAMGLAMIVSNVGSIHDYCDESNAVFCDNSANSFTEAINNLSSNVDKVLRMRESSLLKSQKFHIENVHKWFSELD